MNVNDLLQKKLSNGQFLLYTRIYRSCKTAIITDLIQRHNFLQKIFLILKFLITLIVTLKLVTS